MKKINNPKSQIPQSVYPSGWNVPFNDTPEVHSIILNDNGGEATISGSIIKFLIDISTKK